MASIVAAGLGIAVAATAGKIGIRAWQKYTIQKGGAAALTQFYKGGFSAKMDRLEASRILGLKYVVISCPSLSFHANVSSRGRASG